MSLNDILKSIQIDTDKEIEKLNKDTEEKIKKIEKEYSKKFAEKKEKTLKIFQANANKKISQSSFKAKSLLNEELLSKKRQLIKDVYTKTAKKLLILDEQEYIKVIQKLINNLPEVADGQIIPAEKDADIIKGVLEKKGLTYKVLDADNSIEGGFIFKSEGLTIKNDISSIIKRLKEETETEVGNILFN